MEYSSLGILYIVGTPIGNLSDISKRALETLEKVDEIWTENQTNTKSLLSKLNINNKVYSYLNQSIEKASGLIYQKLEEGKQIAIVSDAGMPGISDPGNALVKNIRSINSNIKIFTIPGPSALTSFISISGLENHQFLFLGFPPTKKGRVRLFEELVENTKNKAVIIYESPHRVLKTLEEIEKITEQKNLKNIYVCVGRELTKIYESFYQGSIQEVKTILKKEFPQRMKGEFVISFEQRQNQ